MIILTADTFIIREYNENDFEEYHKLYSNAEVMKYISFKSNSIDESRIGFKACLDESRKEKDRIKYYLVIEDISTKAFIGEIGYSIICKTINTGICNMGYFIKKSYWNKGIVTKAAKLIIQYIFEHTQMHKIETGCVKENITSEKVMIKCGFKKEAELRKHSLIENKWYDRLEYGLLKEEWR